MKINHEKRYIVFSNEEKTYLSDIDFQHFFRANQNVEEVSFWNEIDTKMIQMERHFFHYNNYSKEIDVGIYGFPYSLGSLIADSKVGDFPSYLRMISQFYRVFSECSDYSASGIYDMEEQRLLFEGLRMADLGDVFIENRDVNICCRQMTKLYQWSLIKKVPLVAVGGDHILTYVVQMILRELQQEKVVVVILDAHHDCKNTLFEDEQVNHANFVRKLTEFNNIEKIIQIGVRGVRSISNIVFHDKIVQYCGVQDIDELKKELRLCYGYKIYLSIDLDVIDPVIYPCVDFGIPNGFTVKQLRTVLKTIFEEKLEFIGCDLVEGLPEKNNQYSQIPINVLSIVLDCIRQNLRTQ